MLYPKEAFFQRKDSAEEYLDAIEKTRKKEKWFCPAIKDACKESCVCFTEAKMEPGQQRKTGTDGWIVLNAYCDNATFNGFRSGYGST